MLLLLENFDNADELRHISGTVTLTPGAGKGGSNAAASLNSGNHINFIPSHRAVIGFYTREYTTGIIYFGYTTPGGSSYEAFRITFVKKANGKVTISFYNPRQSYISGYPAITNQIAYQDTVTGYSLMEIYLDLTNATAHTGEVKISMDGFEYVNLSNIVNAPIDQFTEGLNSDQANYAWVAFSGFSLIDSLYVCNEEKGFNDDFFGPFDIATLTPLMDGDYSNWERRENSISVPEDDPRGNSYFVTKDQFDPDNANYLNTIASQTLVKDLFYFASAGVPGTGDIMALEQRIWHKGLSADQATNLCVITPIAKASGRDITFEPDYENLAQVDYFKQLRIPYDVVPTVATSWTRENLGNTQFGYCFYETEDVNIASEAELTSTNIVYGALANIVDGNESTYLRASNVTFTFASAIKVKKLTFLVSRSATITNAKIYDEDGNEFAMNAPSTVGTTTTITNQSAHYLKNILQIKVTLNSSYYLYLANVFSWEKVGA